jgi:RNA polymerase sigma-70 factor, ECF subfamily
MTRIAATLSAPSNPELSRLNAIVRDNKLFITRTLSKAGVPQSELDDQVQQTFIIAAARLADMQVGSERMFLYQVALNLAAHMRRTLARRREVSDDRMPEQVEAFATPEHLASRSEMRRLLDEVAARMDASLLEVFNLFQFEGISLKEIATRFRLPRGTVASRLRRARVQFRKHATEIDLAWDLGSEAGKQLEEPKVMSRENLSMLMQALLGAGASPGPSDAMRIGTLAALGLAAPKRLGRGPCRPVAARKPQMASDDFETAGTLGLGTQPAGCGNT